MSHRSSFVECAQSDKVPENVLNKVIRFKMPERGQLNQCKMQLAVLCRSQLSKLFLWQQLRADDSMYSLSLLCVQVVLCAFATLGAAVKTRSRSRRSSKEQQQQCTRGENHFQFSIFNFQWQGKHVQPALGGLCWIYMVTKNICCPYGMYTNRHTCLCAWYLCKWAVLCSASWMKSVEKKKNALWLCELRWGA